MNQPLVSIVLPTFNGAAHLPEAIDSCLGQTHSNLELVVVDDRSTDETAEIIARYAAADPRVRAVRHEENRKLPAALNSGFGRAAGKYATWTSDDNRYEPSALAKMVAFLEDNESADVVYTGYHRIDETGRTTALGLLLAPSLLGYRGNVVNPCFLFRREVYEAAGGYAEDLFLAEDYFFWLMAARRCRFAHIADDLYGYREHADSLTAQKKEGILQATLRALRTALDRTDRSNRDLRAGMMIHAAGLHLHFHEKEQARKMVAGALATAPLRVLRRAPKGMLAAVLLGRDVADRLFALRQWRKMA